MCRLVPAWHEVTDAAGFFLGEGAGAIPHTDVGVFVQCVIFAGNDATDGFS